MQRIIDRILRPFRRFCRAYINNIVIFSSSLKEYIRYLIQVFQVLNEMNIYLALNKTFLEYSFMSLLDQRINVLELAIAEKKL